MRISDWSSDVCSSDLVAGGLVGQEDQRAVHEGTRDRDALLLAAGELVGEVAHLLGQADQLEDGRDLRLDDVAGPADHLEGAGDVLVDRLVGEKLEGLEDAELGRAASRERVGSVRVDLGGSRELTKK